MKTIFLVTKDGVEWQIPIEAHECEIKANKRVIELDANLNPKNVIDRISHYDVTEVKYVPKVGIRDLEAAMKVLQDKINATFQLPKITAKILSQNDDWAVELVMLHQRLIEMKKSA